jgi:hypothetical protein
MPGTPEIAQSRITNFGSFRSQAILQYMPGTTTVVANTTISTGKQEETLLPLLEKSYDQLESTH